MPSARSSIQMASSYELNAMRQKELKNSSLVSSSSPEGRSMSDNKRTGCSSNVSSGSATAGSPALLSTSSVAVGTTISAVCSLDAMRRGEPFHERNSTEPGGNACACTSAVSARKNNADVSVMCDRYTASIFSSLSGSRSKASAASSRTFAKRSSCSSVSLLSDSGSSKRSGRPREVRSGCMWQVTVLSQ